MRTNTTAGLASVAVLLGGCQMLGAGDAALENTVWQPVDFAKAHLVLDAAKSQARGNTGCNSFAGQYELSGDALRFRPLAVTRRACLDPEMNRQESAFLKALQDTRTWRVNGKTLLLTGEAGQTARFAAQ